MSAPAALNNLGEDQGVLRRVAAGRPIVTGKPDRNWPILRPNGAHGGERLPAESGLGSRGSRRRRRSRRLVSGERKLDNK